MTRETGLANCKMVPVLIGTFRYDIRTALRPLCGHRFVSRPIAIGDFVEIQRQRRFFERTESCPSMLPTELLRPLREPYSADSAGGTAFVNSFQTNHSSHRVAELVEMGRISCRIPRARQLLVPFS